MIDRLRCVTPRQLIRGVACAAFMGLLATLSVSVAAGQAAGQSTTAERSIVEDYGPVTAAMLIDPPAGDWLMWRRTYGHWGYSPLEQINRSNVDELRLAWAWTMERGLQETTPLARTGTRCSSATGFSSRHTTHSWWL